MKVSAAEAGTYTLHMELVTESSGLTDAAPLAMGGEANGILTTATEDADYFRLEAAEATSVLLRLARTGQAGLARRAAGQRRGPRSPPTTTASFPAA